jgi:hypothetical protein
MLVREGHAMSERPALVEGIDQGHRRPGSRRQPALNAVNYWRYFGILCIVDDFGRERLVGGGYLAGRCTRGV